MMNDDFEEEDLEEVLSLLPLHTHGDGILCSLCQHFYPKAIVKQSDFYLETTTVPDPRMISICQVCHDVVKTNTNHLINLILSSLDPDDEVGILQVKQRRDDIMLGLLVSRGANTQRKIN